MKKRVLKFRAWHKDIKHMFYAQPNGEFIGEVNEERVCSDFDFKDLLDEEVKWPYVPMQFTGMLDKNKKEIWEGDIVKAALMHHGEAGTPFTAFIFYNEHIGSFRIGYDSLGGGAQDEIYFRYQIEVIGNVYENPKLLKSN